MAKRATFDFDLIVIGSGAGGSGAATIAARKGSRVAIIEADSFGGESPNWGDVPTKGLLHAIQLFDEAKRGSRFGIRSAMLSYNFPSLSAWKELVVKRTGAGGNRQHYDNLGIKTFHGVAHFLSPNEISVNRRHLSAKNFIIATGSELEIPNIAGLDTVKYLTPRDFHKISRPPKSILIIGGSNTSVELAQLLAILGTKVYIAEIASRLLPREDAEVGELMERLLKEKNGVTVLTQTRIVSVVNENVAKRVTFLRGETEKSVRVDEVLVCAGRKPAVDLGLENASVEYTPKGIEVNKHLQTSASHIFAAGGVLGRDGFTHSALLESRIAIHNILNKNKIEPDYTATPRITFSFPAIASVGLSDDDCHKRDLQTKIAIAPLNSVARSNTSDFRDGFVKIITDKKGVILGATVVAPHAGEIIHELALAIKHNLTAADVAATPHAFLSWSEAVRVAAVKLS